MPDAKDDLRATSEAVQDEAERLADMEARKQSLDPADPRVEELSREIEEMAKAIARKSTIERELSEEIQGAESGGSG